MADILVILIAEHPLAGVSCTLKLKYKPVKVPPPSVTEVRTFSKFKPLKLVVYVMP